MWPSGCPNCGSTREQACHAGCPWPRDTCARVTEQEFFCKKNVDSAPLNGCDVVEDGQATKANAPESLTLAGEEDTSAPEVKIMPEMRPAGKPRRQCRRSQSGDALTSRQAEVLAFMFERVAEDGCPPTLRDIARRFGLSSINGVRQHLVYLQLKGAVTQDRRRIWWPKVWS